MYQNNVWYDDRTDMTIGKRVKELRSVGIPYLIVVGKKVQTFMKIIKFVRFLNKFFF